MCTCREYKEPYRQASPAGSCRRYLLLAGSGGGRASGPDRPATHHQRPGANSGLWPAPGRLSRQRG